MSDNKQGATAAILSLRQQRLLLEIEYNTEREAYRRQTETIGLRRKVKRGDAWYPIRAGRSYYNSLNQLVVEIHRTSDDDMEHNFEYGRPVCFFQVNESGTGTKIKYFNFTCTVNYADGDRMVVIVPDSGRVAEIQHSENLGVQLFFDETSYRLMFEALDRTMQPATIGWPICATCSTRGKKQHSSLSPPCGFHGSTPPRSAPSMRCCEQKT